MNMKIMQLRCENFKGQKSFEADFDGENAIITAQNGVGKTTVFDMFLWLLFNKDSLGRSDFEVRPLDKDNKPVNGLVLVVEAVLEIDGEIHTFRKEQREKYIKDALTGFETLCYIDLVPKKVSEYTKYINEIVNSDTFRVLTDLTYFNNLHWTKRRALLLEIAGNIGSPAGFEELLAALNGRSIEDYKKVLAGQKDRLKKDRDEIPSRIDEIQRGLNDYAEKDTTDLDRQRKDITAKIKRIDDMRAGVFAQEQARQKKIDEKNALQTKRIKREGELQNDTSGITGLLNEKAEIEKAVAEIGQQFMSAKNAEMLTRTEVKGKQSELNGLIQRRSDILAEMKRAAEVDTGINTEPEPDVCPYCEQKLPAKKLAAMQKKIQDNIALAEARKQRNIADITKRGNAIKEAIDTANAHINALTAALEVLQDKAELIGKGLVVCQLKMKKRFAEIDTLIHNNPKPDPTKDKDWQQIIADIEKLESEIGEPTGDQITALDNRRTILNSELVEANKALADADNAKKAKARIIELGEQEKALAQQLAEIERLLAMIGDYTQKESELIETSVNGMFKHVRFKMFETCLNGNIEPACEATFHGTPYGGLSTGETIFVDIDIINVLAEHYKINAPLFMDRAESFTMPMEASCQVIQLKAVKGLKKLTIELDRVLEAAK